MADHRQGVAVQHSLWYGERVEVREHRQHGRPPQEVQVQHNRPPGGGDPSAVHVFHQRAHEGGEVFTFSPQTSSINNKITFWTFLRPSELKYSCFPPVFTDDILFRPQKENSTLNIINCRWFCASQWKRIRQSHKKDKASSELISISAEADMQQSQMRTVNKQIEVLALHPPL